MIGWTYLRSSDSNGELSLRLYPGLGMCIDLGVERKLRRLQGDVPHVPCIEWPQNLGAANESVVWDDDRMLEANCRYWPPEDIDVTNLTFRSWELRTYSGRSRSRRYASSYARGLSVKRVTPLQRRTERGSSARPQVASVSFSSAHKYFR
ncbi:hypothetical protein DENSPDRAFT_835620 [Dentipellis sp. KUC8613]|nr:hypothetical protein DENSPDRAFT_835620 [Dentipellis sp. KUC8613]